MYIARSNPLSLWMVSKYSKSHFLALTHASIPLISSWNVSLEFYCMLSSNAKCLGGTFVT